MRIKLLSLSIFFILFTSTFSSVNFHSKLSKEQNKVMTQIYREAKKSKINPNFAINLAFAESSFKVDAYAKESYGRKSIGPMQVLNTTAMEMGYSEKQLKNKDLNIKIGLSYLEVIKFKYYGREINDIAVAATYNHGIGNMKRKLKKGPIYYRDLPKTTQKYLSNIFQKKFSKDYIVLS